MKTSFIGLSFIFIFYSTTFADVFTPCNQDIVKQKARSKELQSIVSKDQEDRKVPVEQIDWKNVWHRDEARRKRVGEIFGEGCFKIAEDYAAASLVYQHGTIPDHFFQTFIWAKRAVELGDIKSKRLMAFGIDRFLVHSGRKQLFGTQAAKLNGSNCWCLNQVEISFPSTLRAGYSDKTLEQAFEWVDSMNNPECKPAKYCEEKLKDSPSGTVPGFW